VTPHWEAQLELSHVSSGWRALVQLDSSLFISQLSPASTTGVLPLQAHAITSEHPLVTALSWDEQLLCRHDEHALAFAPSAVRQPAVAELPPPLLLLEQANAAAATAIARPIRVTLFMEPVPPLELRAQTTTGSCYGQSRAGHGIVLPGSLRGRDRWTLRCGAPEVP
jgi:hypothetical protein